MNTVNKQNGAEQKSAKKRVRRITKSAVKTIAKCAYAILNTLHDERKRGIKMREVKRAVKKFKKMLGKQPLSIESAINVLKSNYNSEVIFCSKEAWEQLAKDKKISSVRAECTYCRKADEHGFKIFMKDGVSDENKLIDLLSVIGKMLLLIIYAEDYGLRNQKAYCCIKSGAFAYAVLTSKSIKKGAVHNGELTENEKC